jgi:hypothetical protein
MSDDDTVTMTKAEATALQNAYGMLNKLYNHPDKAMEFKKLAKEAGYKVPELDTLEKVTKPIEEKFETVTAENKKLKERLDKWENDNLSLKEETALKAQLDTVRKQFSLNDEGMQKVIDRMKAKNNPDVEAAAAFVLSQEPKAKPTTNTHNFAQGKFNGSNLVGGGEQGEKAWNTLMKDAANNSDDYFSEVVNDVFNNPENSREFGGTL